MCSRRNSRRSSPRSARGCDTGCRGHCSGPDSRRSRRASSWHAPPGPEWYRWRWVRGCIPESLSGGKPCRLRQGECISTRGVPSKNHRGADSRISIHPFILIRVTLGGPGVYPRQHRAQGRTIPCTGWQSTAGYTDTQSHTDVPGQLAWLHGKKQSLVEEIMATQGEHAHSTQAEQRWDSNPEGVRQQWCPLRNYDNTSFDLKNAVSWTVCELFSPLL